MDDKKQKLRKAAPWAGAGTLVTTAAFLNPETAVEVVKSNQGLVSAIAVAAWHIVIKPLLSHLSDIQVKLGAISDTLTRFEEKFEDGAKRMDGLQDELKEVRMILRDNGIRRRE